MIVVGLLLLFVGPFYIGTWAYIAALVAFLVAGLQKWDTTRQRRRRQRYVSAAAVRRIESRGQ